MRLTTLSFLLPLFAVACFPGTDAGEEKDQDDVDTNTNPDDTDDTDDSGNNPGDNDGDGYTVADGDCDDDDKRVNPGAEERCDGKDNDCDGDTDVDATDANEYYADNDGDGYGTGRPVEACEAPDDHATRDGDCDDDNRRVFPGAEEVCNEVDDDCDGSVDEDATDMGTYYDDADGDGYGGGRGTDACEQPAGTVTEGSDCDDGDPAIHPGAEELCNGVDDDCDDRVDDGATGDTYYYDTDGDGYGDPSSTVEDCDQPRGTVTNADDCDDGDATINPAGEEVCDGVDNDCDGNIDTDATDATYLYLDSDGDGFGDASSYDLRCNGVDNDYDCDDGDDTEPQVVDAAATGTPDGSIGAPWSSIQDGIDGADTCVLVWPGVYEETIDFSGKDILVRGVGGADATIIDGQGAGAVATFNGGEGAGAELVGFTLANGSGYEEETTSSRSCGSSTTCTDHFTMICGGGIYVDGAEPTLHNLVLRQNIVETPADSSTSTDFYYYFGFGGGLCVRNATLAVDALKIEQNAADDGGGIYVESGASLEVTHSTLYSNTAENGAGVLVDGGSFEASNSIFAWNSASNAGGGIHAVDASVVLVNVTIGECEAPGDGGGGLNASGSTSLRLLNSILYGANAGYGIVVGSSASYSGSYSNVYGNTADEYSGITDPTGTSGNISTDPGFVSITDDGDYTNDDWSLSTGSACINTGNSSAAYNDDDGTRNDMGAYGGPAGAW